MLQYLHVKNLALIDEIEVEFGRGLNILTGETGAGKSIILGSVNLALGGRYTKDILRQGTRYGLVELTFSVESERQRFGFTKNLVLPEPEPPITRIFLFLAYFGSFGLPEIGRASCRERV